MLSAVRERLGLSPRTSPSIHRKKPRSRHHLDGLCSPPNSRRQSPSLSPLRALGPYGQHSLDDTDCSDSDCCVTSTAASNVQIVVEDCASSPSTRSPKPCSLNHRTSLDSSLLNAKLMEIWTEGPDKEDDSDAVVHTSSRSRSGSWKGLYRPQKSPEVKQKQRSSSLKRNKHKKVSPTQSLAADIAALSEKDTNIVVMTPLNWESEDEFEVRYEHAYWK